MKPLSVTGVGGRHIFPADRECDDHVYCTFEFPGTGYYKDDDTHEVADPNKKIVVTYSSINGNGFGGYGEIVIGTKGTLILEQEQDAMLFKGSATTTRIEVKHDRTARPAMDTYETGGGAAVAQAATGRQHQPRLPRRDRALGVVHPQPGPGAQAALHAGSGAGRRGDRAHQQPGDRQGHSGSSSTRHGSTSTAHETPEGSTPRQASQVT